MFSGLPCESHIAHIARIARTRGTVRVRRLAGIEASRPRHLPGIDATPAYVPHALCFARFCMVFDMVFAWVLHGAVA